MATARFTQLFVGLMIVAFLMAFIIPAKFTTATSGELQGIFAPVSRPVGALARFLDRRFHTPVVVDDRSPQQPRTESTIFEENHRLLSAYASLQKKFEELSQLNADRQAVGDIRSLCKPATVTGAEVSGLHEALTISAGSYSAAMKDRPVIRGNPSQSPLPCDLIGRVFRAGNLGAQVRLITDPGFRLTARIARYVQQEDGSLKLTYIGQLHPLVQGIGNNAMSIQSNLTLTEVKASGMAVNDMVLLDDHEWPANLQGFEVGRITQISRQPKAPLLAEIRIEPQTRLMRLTEVMVMMKD